MTLPWDEIGGGIVRLAFTSNGKRMLPGSRLTAEEIHSMSNGRTLIRTGHIVPHPPANGQNLETVPSSEKYLFHIGGGKYVVSGPLLTREPVSKEEAEAIMNGRSVISRVS